MAHMKQQRKRIRQDKVKQTANAAKKSAVKSTVKKFETSVAKGDKKDIATGFKAAMSSLAKSARQGVMTKGAAARKISRLAAKIRNAAKA